MAKLPIIFITFLIVSISSHGAIQRNLSRVNLDLKKISGNLNAHEKNLLTIKESILSLKQHVKNETEKFSKIISLKNNLKDSIYNKRESLSLEKKEIKKEELLIKEIFAGMLLLDETEDEIDYRYITLEKLKEKESVLKQKKEKIEQMVKALALMEKELDEYDFLESELIKNIEISHEREKKLKGRFNTLSVALNNEKTKLVNLKKEKNQIIRANNRKALIEQKRKKNLKKIVADKKNVKALKPKDRKDSRQSEDLKNAKVAVVDNDDFVLPVSEFSKVQKDKMGGLSFYVDSARQIKAPSDGVVLYTGKLSTYGNVVVIKHFDGKQSIILGNIISNVGKGDSLKKGEFLGRVIENNGDLKKVYYELRNKDKSKKVEYSKVFNGLKI